MFIDCRHQSPEENYFTLIQTVIPRPIAWVLSDNGNASYNLAPFSFFNVVSANPPMIMLSIGWKDEKTRKDTWVNIEARKDFVVHLPSVDDIADVAASAATLAHGESEINRLGCALTKTEGQRLPRLSKSKVAFFCELFSIQELGEDRQAMILGKINHIFLDDTIAQQRNGRLIVDAKALAPLARLGGAQYSVLGEILTMKRPE